MSSPASYPALHATTVIAVRHQGHTALGADGQATLGTTIAKNHVKKVRTFLEGKVVTGFAGATADAFALLDRFEGKLTDYAANLRRAAIELTKEWRMDRYLRKLEAMLVVASQEHLLILSGTGDVLEPDEGVAAIGSGAMYAQSAAMALKAHAPHLSAEQIVRESLRIAAQICIYTNDQITIAQPL